MDSALISPKYQIVIPKNVRTNMGLAPGERMFFITFPKRLELIPERNLKSMRGILEGMDSYIDREENDRI